MKLSQSNFNLPSPDCYLVRGFVFLFLTEEALKPRWAPDKEVWPNPISVSKDD